MKILVVGNGGREHALAWKLKKSPRVTRVFVAPGNAGTAIDAENVDIPSEDIPALVKFAKQNAIDLTVVGPEMPLVAGLVDAFQASKLRVFGPTRAAAQLEGSKVFCKNLLHSADVPTADYHVFRDPESATRFVTDRYPSDDESVPLVIKADGLAAGKGVVVCSTRRDALSAIDRIGRQKEFGAAGKQIVVEERLDGQEASVLAFTDGRTIVTLPPAQDHKPAYDGDAGPNTGGMGAYCPAPLVGDKMLRWIEEHILVPTVHAMKRSRQPFKGVLYAGLMITHQGPKVLEYNVRLGDPECQPLLMRLDSDLVDLLEATIDSRLDEIAPPKWDPRPSVSVVMASEGYPGNYEKGRPIRGLEEAAAIPDVKVFHSGTTIDANGNVVTSGGRVLAVTALGTTISAAKLQAYTAVKCIRWQGAWCRKDISDKALAGPREDFRKR
ncbi:phosphoribosylamine/glycine ligase [Pirellula staleyi DSM 6068]|uniref:Phosphoribosylamine--glycine ligase n=1 Tax=Pirellula staleyi (strain ATCC 27377 / DSM 6068 / ICPB 4128) TaxID=530564 RepID=D2R8R2_PIRSD|nr:phosphoribosylamine--glycine ligase [Pirellula staleyi]ADB17603.1 phosphoribosylamine/glycine ligase [Pirellula staleyi DSM 6068]